MIGSGIVRGMYLARAPPEQASVTSLQSPVPSPQPKAPSPFTIRHQTSPPMGGSLMLSSPSSTCPASWYRDLASPLIVNARSYQPLVCCSDQCFDSLSPASSTNFVVLPV